MDLSVYGSIMRENWQKGSFTRDFERYIEEGFGN
jgi:hypothetical protein